MTLEQTVNGWGRKWPAPAKLNLMLRIVGRREDGYHLLQTVFQMIDLCDWITFHEVEDGRVSLLRQTPGVVEQDDLTIRAANLLKEASGCQRGVCIEIEKKLPMGGGLGGGSSDAATTLVVLNRLWQLGFSTDRLMALGLVLGADVPVFVYGQNSWGEGVGERLEKVSLPGNWFVIIKPDCHVNTRQIFLNKDLTRDSKKIRIADFMAGDRKNDCLEVVRSAYEEVGDAMVALSRFAEPRLTGTGACVFAEFSDAGLAEAAYCSLKDKWSAFLAKGTSISLLHEKLC